MKAITKTRAVGGSLMVTIPASIAKEETIGENETVEIEIHKIRKDFFGVLKGIGSFKKEDRFKGQFEE